MSEQKGDLEKMQRDAEQRLRDMQRRSRNAVNSGDMPPVPNFVQVGTRQGHRPQQSNSRRPTPPEEAHKEPKPQNKPPLMPKSNKGGKGFDLLKMLNFKNLKIDSDVMIIVALIFLLSTEETDELLLMALVYIML